jgi:hypothetical protein
MGRVLFFFVVFLRISASFGQVQEFSLQDWLPEETIAYGYVKEIPRVYQESRQVLSGEAMDQLERQLQHRISSFLKWKHWEASGKLDIHKIQEVLASIEEIQLAFLEIGIQAPSFFQPQKAVLRQETHVILQIKLKNPEQVQDFIQYLTDQDLLFSPFHKYQGVTSLYWVKKTFYQLRFYFGIQGQSLLLCSNIDVLKKMLRNQVWDEDKALLSAKEEFRQAIELTQQEAGHYSFLFFNPQSFSKVFGKRLSPYLKGKFYEWNHFLELEHLQAISIQSHLTFPKALTSFHVFFKKPWSFYETFRLEPRSFQILHALPPETAFAFMGGSAPSLATFLQKAYSYLQEKSEKSEKSESTEKTSMWSSLQEAFTWNTLNQALGQEVALFLLPLESFDRQYLDRFFSQMVLVLEIQNKEPIQKLLEALEQHEGIAQWLPPSEWQDLSYQGIPIRLNYPPYSPFPLLYGFSSKYLFIGFSPQVLERCILSAQAKEVVVEGVETNSLFQKLKLQESQNVQASHFVYWDSHYFIGDLLKEMSSSPVLLQWEESSSAFQVHWHSSEADQVLVGHLFVQIWSFLEQELQEPLRNKCRYHLYSIHQAVHLYFKAKGSYPQSFEDLYEGQFLSRQFPLYCPADPVAGSYQLVALPQEASGKEILCYTASGIFKGRQVLFLNGTLLYLSEEDFKALMKSF